MFMAQALSRSRCWALGLLKFQDSRVDGYMAICFGSYGAHLYSTVALSGVGPYALQWWWSGLKHCCLASTVHGILLKSQVVHTQIYHIYIYIYTWINTYLCIIPYISLCFKWGFCFPRYFWGEPKRGNASGRDVCRTCRATAQKWSLLAASTAASPPWSMHRGCR